MHLLVAYTLYIFLDGLIRKSQANICASSPSFVRYVLMLQLNKHATHFVFYVYFILSNFRSSILLSVSARCALFLYMGIFMQFFPSLIIGYFVIHSFDILGLRVGPFTAYSIHTFSIRASGIYRRGIKKVKIFSFFFDGNCKLIATFNKLNDALSTLALARMQKQSGQRNCVAHATDEPFSCSRCDNRHYLLSVRVCVCRCDL